MSERIEVLVIGTGSIGERQARCFLATGRAAVSICEIDAGVREAVAGRYELRAAHTDLDAALSEDAPPPAVAVICTPAHLHVEMATRLLSAGVAVLCEKPLSTSLEGTARLAELVAAPGARFAMGYVQRAHPLFAALREQIDGGRFGRPVEVLVVSGQHFPHYRPAYREIYYTRRETGGGVIQDGLTHSVNLVEWLVGPMTRVAADCEHLLLEGVEIEDSVHIIARHGHDHSIMASYTMNQHQAANEGSVTVLCERGTLRAEPYRNRWRFVTEPETPWTDHVIAPLERDEIFVTQAHRFLDHVAGDAPPLCTFAEGLQTLRSILAILNAADSRTWQDV